MVKAAVVQLPPVAVTEVMVTLAPVTVLVNTTVTVASVAAVPLKVGVSEALMMLSVAMFAELMVIGEDGAKLVGSIVIVLPLLLLGEITPARLWRANMVMVPVPKI